MTFSVVEGVARSPLTEEILASESGIRLLVAKERRKNKLALDIVRVALKSMTRLGNHQLNITLGWKLPLSTVPYVHYIMIPKSSFNITIGKQPLDTQGSVCSIIKYTYLLIWD